MKSLGHRIKICLLASTLAVALVPGRGAAAAEAPLDTGAIRNVTIIDLQDGALHSGQTVVWQRSRIIAVGSEKAVTIPGGTQVADGTGKFLLPSFWDMHVHLRFGEKGQDLATDQLTLPLFIANGVTAVRDMSDIVVDEDYRVSVAPIKHRWDAEARAGARVGPRIVATGSFAVDGPSLLQRNKHLPAFFGAATPAEARQLVHYLKDERQVDFIKVYSRIPRDSYFALMDEAKKAGIVVAGHKPLAVSYVEAAEAGQKSMEHAREMILDSWPGAAELQKNPNERNLPPAKLREILDQQDPRMLQEILAAMARNGAYLDPTHTTRMFDWKAAANDGAYLDDTRLNSIHPKAAESAWADARFTLAKVRGPADVKAYEDFFRKGVENTRLAYEAGVKVMLGTDTGDSWCFPGSSLHDEMETLAEGGMKPLAILRAATVIPAEYMGRSADFGAVAPGKLADLLLLDENPLAEIGHTRSIRAVVFNGRYFDRAALDAMLERVKAKAKELRNK